MLVVALTMSVAALWIPWERLNKLTEETAELNKVFDVVEQLIHNTRCYGYLNIELEYIYVFMCILILDISEIGNFDLYSSDIGDNLSYKTNLLQNFTSEVGQNLTESQKVLQILVRLQTHR